VLETSRLWRRVVSELARDYRNVELEHMLVDNAAMQLVQEPERFDVIVTDNMFGDIITDLGAMIQGGMGIAAGGNINPDGVSMFEPIGGTAPDHTGKGTINPLAAIGAMQMLLNELGESEAAARVDAAITFACSKLHSMRAGEMGFTTSEVGDLVVEGMPS
jgi:3-isopropylmalate dehydrogenase